MFSLIITIISIALVAVLALATLYYGGDAFNKGTADAQAAKIVNQGQQLLAAAELFKADAANAGVTMTLAELISRGYLKSVPVAYQGNGSVAEAWAAAEWSMPVADQPVFVADVAATGACKAVNKRTLGLDGILAQAHDSIITQCYGASADSLKAVVGKNAAAFAAVVAVTGDAPGLPDADVVGSGVPAWDASSGWLSGYAPSSAGDAANSASPPSLDVDEPGSCNVLTFERSYHGLRLWNNTGSPMTITAWTGYQLNGGPYMAVGALNPYDGSSNVVSASLPDLSAAWSASSPDDFEAIWQSTTVPANVALPTGEFVFLSGYHGPQYNGIAKGAVYIQELNSWCAFGVHNSTAGGYDSPESGTGYFIGIPGTAAAWTPPVEMNGAWSPVY